MIIEYCQKALEKAEYKKLEDGTWFAEIPDFRGVWANGRNIEECRKELLTILEEWLVLKLRDKDPIPALDGLKDNFVAPNDNNALNAPNLPASGGFIRRQSGGPTKSISVCYH